MKRIYRGFAIEYPPSMKQFFVCETNGKVLATTNSYNEACSWIDFEIRRQRLEVFPEDK